MKNSEFAVGFAAMHNVTGTAPRYCFKPSTKIDQLIHQRIKRLTVFSETSIALLYNFASGRTDVDQPLRLNMI